MGAMAQVDVNADGRTDVVFAYQGRPVSDPSAHVERVYLNTATGFQLAPASRFVFPEAQYGVNRTLRRFSFSIDWLTSSGAGQVLGDTSVPDMGRMADVDGDGLVDLWDRAGCRFAATVRTPSRVPAGAA